MTGPDTTANEPIADLAAFVADCSYHDVPDEAIRLVERAILDTVGVTIAGSSTEVAAAALATVAGEEGETTVIGRDESLPLGDAVFVNGTAGHALDYDDVALAAMDGHPSVPMVAPLLAVGEREGASGRDVLTGYVAGFETQHYVSSPISPGHYEGGWHATSTIGVFGAAAAVANLLDLTVEETTHALNVAASMASGLKKNFGSSTKPLHAGHAARSGTMAALLAANGATADPTAIDGERGFLDLYRGDGTPDFERLSDLDLGSRWSILEEGVDVKKYPCCYYTHAAIHGAADLARERGLEPDDVESVTVAASRGAADALHHDDPSTGLEAKFSMPYVVARAIVDRVDLAAFDDENVGDEDVQAVRERVTLTVDEDEPYDSNAARVAVRTRDGETLERYQERPPGTYEDPLSIDELREKFLLCAEYADGEVRADAALDALDTLRDVPDVSGALEHL
ncbi:MmgE/PrpD family protein [Natrialbaceae archaeon GCM10025810]|uniref:MmgE/PrpD family protein n=1 Tax=Halovalidus salilacus TaxID=3075124 RepID=UPI00360F8D59